MARKYLEPPPEVYHGIDIICDSACSLGENTLSNISNIDLGQRSPVPRVSKAAGSEAPKSRLLAGINVLAHVPFIKLQVFSLCWTF